MKLAIYGDSFGFRDQIYIRKEFKHVGLSWPALLEQDYDITHYCVPACDVWYSYDHFLKHHEKYDYNIFIVTGSDRLSVNLPTGWVHSHGYDSAVGKLRTEKDKEKQKVLEATKHWFKYIHRFEKEKQIKKLIVNDVRQKGALLIDSFGENGLYNITEMENNVWNKKLKYNFNLDNTIDIRHCHMTKENNLIMYDLIKEAIKNNTWNFNIDNFIKPTFEEKDLYFISKF